MNKKRIQTAVPIELFQVSNQFQEAACRLQHLLYFSIETHLDIYLSNNSHTQQTHLLEVDHYAQLRPDESSKLFLISKTQK